MSLEKMDFDLMLKLALTEAGIWVYPHPHRIIGRAFRFDCRHGSHHEILVGTIVAIKISDEGGLDLFVSSPRFWGKPLISIKRSNGKWMAYVDVEPPKWADGDFGISEAQNERKIDDFLTSKFFEGTFHLLK